VRLRRFSKSLPIIERPSARSHSQLERADREVYPIYCDCHRSRVCRGPPGIPCRSATGNLTQLQILLAYKNTFEGPLPASLGNLQQLNGAGLSNNKFTGPLPREIFNLSSLTDDLYLSYNYFVGSLPLEVGSLTNLVHLYISENNLSGPLPDSLGNCLSMMKLRLNGNSFGAIPHPLVQCVA
jgi:Leucine-rich repeat (LRR) protein